MLRKALKQSQNLSTIGTGSLAVRLQPLPLTNYGMILQKVGYKKWESAPEDKGEIFWNANEQNMSG